MFYFLEKIVYKKIVLEILVNEIKNGSTFAYQSKIDKSLLKEMINEAFKISTNSGKIKFKKFPNHYLFSLYVISLLINSFFDGDKLEDEKFNEELAFMICGDVLHNMNVRFYENCLKFATNPNDTFIEVEEKLKEYTDKVYDKYLKIYI